jgi:hypothetical protein
VGVRDVNEATRAAARHGVEVFGSDGRLGRVERFLLDPATNSKFWALVHVHGDDTGRRFAPTRRRRRFSRPGEFEAWMPLHHVAAAHEAASLRVPFAIEHLEQAADVVGPDEDPEGFVDELRKIYGEPLGGELEALLDETGGAWPAAPSGLELKEVREAPKQEAAMTESHSVPHPEGPQDDAPSRRPLSDAEREAVIARGRRELPRLTKQARNGIRGLRRIARR